MADSAYSFIDVVAAITGPGGSFNLGYGAAVAEEGILISMVDDKNTMVIGADGKFMHSLHAGRGGTVTVNLLKISPTNSLLSKMYLLQTTSSSLHGNNVITIRNTASGDLITCSGCAFKKLPDLTYAKDGTMNAWVFDAGYVDQVLGAGV